MMRFICENEPAQINKAVTGIRALLTFFWTGGGQRLQKWQMTDWVA